MATAALSATMPGSDSQKSLSLLNVRVFSCSWAFQMLESPRAPIYVPICLDDLSTKSSKWFFPKYRSWADLGLPPPQQLWPRRTWPALTGSWRMLLISWWISIAFRSSHEPLEPVLLFDGLERMGSTSPCQLITMASLGWTSQGAMSSTAAACPASSMEGKLTLASRHGISEGCHVGSTETPGSLLGSL